MTDIVARIGVSLSETRIRIAERVKEYLRFQCNEIKSGFLEAIRKDGFPDQKYMMMRGPRPKVMELYYLCVDCDVLVPVDDALRCEKCGSAQTMPVHRHENPIYDIRRRLREAEVRKAEKQALGAL